MKICVIDTETADLSDNVYDIGWTVIDKRGNIEQEYNCLVREVFTDANKMMGAFYAKKLFSHYAPMLDNNQIHLESWGSAITRLNKALEVCDVIAAYNAAFDFRVMGQTHRTLGFSGKVIKAPIKTLDIWRFACETKLSQKTFVRLARRLGWVSTAGNIKTGAEYAYRYCRGDWGFIEDHTALSDAKIESAILADCFATKKRVPYGELGGAPWRIVQEVVA